MFVGAKCVNDAIQSELEEKSGETIRLKTKLSRVKAESPAAIQNLQDEVQLLKQENKNTRAILDGQLMDRRSTGGDNLDGELLRSRTQTYRKSTVTTSCRTLDQFGLRVLKGIRRAMSFAALFGDYTVFRSATVVKTASEETNSATSEEHRQFIFCNGRRFWVTRNLLDAIRDLPLSTCTLQYIWIDAICINQVDLAERSAQVSIMGDVYRLAHSVTVWLGTEDKHARPVLEMLKDFSRAHEEFLRNVVHDSTEAETTARVALPITKSQAKTLAWFFARTWFSRAWILQEIVVAREVLVFCSRLRISWGLLSNASKHIAKHQWGRDIARLATLGHEGFVLHVGIVPSMIAQYRKVAMAGRMSFEQGLVLTRSSESTDPRDKHSREQREKHARQFDEKIQAMIAAGFARYDLRREIAEFGFPVPQEDEDEASPVDATPTGVRSISGTILTDRLERNQLPTPHYKKSVAQVYIESTQLAILDRSSLTILSHVGGSSERKTPDLPSWVPDFTTAIAPCPLSDFVGFDCAPGRKLKTREFVTFDKILPIQGSAWDMIVDLGETRDEAVGGEGMYGWISTALALDSPYITGEDRVDVLWRTLIADQYAGIHPAPDSALLRGKQDTVPTELKRLFHFSPTFANITSTGLIPSAADVHSWTAEYHDAVAAATMRGANDDALGRMGRA
ncbi:MAG: Ankyrin-2 [Pleopsidium flavum]|nr:MAG: Ankyrin-2 [Pleopsidium flavum]